MTFVSDTARAIILSLIKDGITGETLNVGSERSITVKEILKMISEIMGKNVTIKIDSSRFRPHDVDSLVCDYSRASRLLGWKPEISIREGLETTINWAQKSGINIKKPFKGWNTNYREDK